MTASILNGPTHAQHSTFISIPIFSYNTEPLLNMVADGQVSREIIKLNYQSRKDVNKIAATLFDLIHQQLSQPLPRPEFGIKIEEALKQLVANRAIQHHVEFVRKNVWEYLNASDSTQQREHLLALDALAARKHFLRAPFFTLAEKLWCSMRGSDHKPNLSALCNEVIKFEQTKYSRTSHNCHDFVAMACEALNIMSHAATPEVVRGALWDHVDGSREHMFRPPTDSLMAALQTLEDGARKTIGEFTNRDKPRRKLEKAYLKRALRGLNAPAWSKRVARDLSSISLLACLQRVRMSKVFGSEKAHQRINNFVLECVNASLTKLKEECTRRSSTPDNHADKIWLPHNCFKYDVYQKTVKEVYDAALRAQRELHLAVWGVPVPQAKISS